MIRLQPSSKPSPAERAHILVMKQEARRRRIERLIEEQMHEHSVYEDCMKGEAYYALSVLHHQGTQWECTELARVNATRPASRICFTLPASSYEASSKACMSYCDAD
jgi:hypothetical protein